MIGFKAASIIRSIFGTLACGELHYEYEMDISKPSLMLPSHFRQIHDETDFLADLNASTLKISPEIDIRPATLDVLSEAGRHEGIVNFLLMWLAIEAQVGDGNDRKKFCEATLNSKLINYEVGQLFMKRCQYLHNGVRPVIRAFDCYSIKSFLRLAILKPSAVRQRLSEEYEKRILLYWRTRDDEVA